MHIHISFTDQETYNLKAYGTRVRRSMSVLWLLMASLFVLLAALLAVWVAGPEGRVVATWGEFMASGYLNATEAPTLAADSTEPSAAAAPVENPFPNPESWYEEASPYAHEPLVISSGGGMNLPK